MRIAVEFQDERLELEVPPERLVAEWHGPAGSAEGSLGGLVREALESPHQFPPLRQAVVPGDHVAVALDSDLPQAGTVAAAVCDTLVGAGVEAGMITVLVPPGGKALSESEASTEDIVWAVHDPDDRSQLAYLATTSGGRRVYLNRVLTDADVVVPVGRLGYDSVLGYRGPWSVIFPGLSDRETARAFQKMTSTHWPDRDQPREAFVESAEVSWLLGTQFHLGIVPGTHGPAAVIAGLDSAVRREGARAVDQAWTFEAPARAELVVVGIGQAGSGTTIAQMAAGLANAVRLVERGGKIAVLSRAEGPIGPALRCLLDVEDPRLAPAALHGHEAEPDYTLAYQVARAMAWADVYLLSALDPALIEGSALVPLERPEQARRLAGACRSCLVLDQADSARARVAGEEEARP